MDLLGVIGEDGHLEQANPAFLQAFGYSLEELQAKPLLEFVHPRDRERCSEEMRQVLPGGRCVHLEHRFRCRDGLYKWMECRTLIEGDRTWIVMRDVTAVKHFLGKTQDETLLRAILESTNYMIFSTDEAGVLKVFNRRCERKLGYRAEEVEETMEWTSFHDPDEIQMRAQVLSEELGVEVEPGMDVFTARALRGMPDEHEWTLIHKDGSSFPAKVSITALRGEFGYISGFLGVAQDITSELQAQEEIHRFAAVVETSNDAIIAESLDGEVQIWNAAAERLFGYTEEEMLGQDAQILVPDELREELSAVHKRLLLGVQIDPFETMRICHDGSRVEIDLTLSLIYGEKGEPLGISSIAHDITRRKLSERLLQDSEKRLRTFIETVVDGIVTISSEGIVESFNPSAQRMFGYAEDEVVGKNVGMLMPSSAAEIHTERIARYLTRRTSDIIGAQTEVIGVRKDGTVFPLELTVNEMELNERLLFAGVLRDVTERREAERALVESEKRYRDLFESANDLIQMVDVNGKLRYANRAWCRALGYEREEILAGDVCLEDILSEESKEHCMDTFCKVMQGERLDRVEAVFVSKSGQEIPVEGSITCKMENGLPFSTRGIFRDISERKEIDRMKNEFISIVSHELRTPLTAIKGSLGLLNGGVLGKLPEKASGIVKVALNNTDRLIRLINDILDLEKIEAGKQEFQFEPIEIDRLVEPTLQGLRPMAEEAGVRLTCSVEPVAVEIDHDRIVQVLTNLVSNAVKFSPKDAAVEVDVHVLDGDRLRISVSDRGPGIPEEERHKLFNKFQQLDSSERPKKDGTGLGLSISKEIVERHNGNIGMESRSGGGCVFFFEIPLKHPRSEKY